MFERYTEHARRVVFLARYEASQFGIPSIETEHLLLGMLRESLALLTRLIPKIDGEMIHKQVEEHRARGAYIATSVDLPLSEESKRALKFAMEEADEVGDKHIGVEHLLLGLLRERKSFAAELLQAQGAEISLIRAAIGQMPYRDTGSSSSTAFHPKKTHLTVDETVKIHGVPRKIDQVFGVFLRLREYHWHWQKSTWRNIDIVIARATGRTSFDLTLAQDTENFQLVKGGWKKGHCAVCCWELFETENAEYGVGYTNGNDWVCTECYEQFWSRGFFRTPYPDIT